MERVTIDILNSNALRVLQDLELCNLIRLNKEEKVEPSALNIIAKYKGKMSKQSTTEIETLLNDLRNGWE